MKVTQVAICPSQASHKAGRPALTPELLAASGARYSRNNEGLEAILSRIDPNELEKSVDSIFRMVDYGHQSIADMVPVAMFIDGVSIWLAYHVWTLCPTAGGQESSTRYLRLSRDGLISPDRLGIPSHLVEEWGSVMEQTFASYQSALALWETLSNERPSIMGIPRSLIEDTSDSAQKKVKRMRRNFAFDRARYFLPVSAATNLMLVMSARGWVSLCQQLLSHPLPEPKALGEAIRRELELAAPRMTRHARFSDSTANVIAREFEKVSRLAGDRYHLETSHGSVPHLSVTPPPGVTQEEIAGDLAWHPNRYAIVGSGLQRTQVRFAWNAVGFAEIRDLNRHRTGTKYCPQVPRGFYFAQDQYPNDSTEGGKQKEILARLAEAGVRSCQKAVELLRQRDASYIYWCVLGTEFPFEHTTTADKFLYEAELRTGLGAHFRYARHLRDMLNLWYQHFPATKGLVLEGSAEPE